MIFSRQEKASITWGISSLFTLVTNSCKFKTENTPSLASGNIKNILSPVKFKRETKKWKDENHPCKTGKI